MSGQPSLFDRRPPAPLPPYAKGSATSRDAALAVRSYIAQQGEIVYAWIAECGSGGATQKEASAALGIGRPSMAARFNALAQAGRIRKTDQRRQACAVYQAIEEMK